MRGRRFHDSSPCETGKTYLPTQGRCRAILYAFIAAVVILTPAWESRENGAIILVPCL